MLSNNSSENLLQNPRLVQLKLKNINVGENLGQSKPHGSSVGKLPSSPNHKISKVNLETSTSNPSLNIIPAQALQNNQLSHYANSLYKVTMLAESQHSSTPAPYKVQGTQAFARTPSKISESDACVQSSIKIGHSALPQKRKPIENVNAFQKLNQTQTSGFAAKVEGNDLLNMANLQNNTSDEQTETHYDQVVLMKATMDAHGQLLPRTSIMKSLTDECDISEGITDSPMTKNHQAAAVHRVKLHPDLLE